VIRSLFTKNSNKQDYLKVRSFTYYIPAPPNRKTGYQEKEFDHIFDYLMENEFDIIDYKLESCSNDSSSGMWIVCILGAKTLKAKNISLEVDYTQIAAQKVQHIQLDPSIEHDH
jgi:hypothetical protein